MGNLNTQQTIVLVLVIISVSILTYFGNLKANQFMNVIMVIVGYKIGKELKESNTKKK